MTAVKRIIGDPDLVLSDTGVEVRQYSDDEGAPRLARHADLIGATTNVNKETRSVKKVANLLTRMRHISQAERNAGNLFYEKFYRASLMPGGITSFEWRPRGRERVSDAVIIARKDLYNAIEALGGLASYTGGVAINCLGWGMTLKDWSKLQGNVTEREARAFLRVSLQILARHWSVGENMVDGY